MYRNIPLMADENLLKQRRPQLRQIRRKNEGILDEIDTKRDEMKVTTDEINLELQQILAMKKSFEKMDVGLQQLSVKGAAKKLQDVDYVKQRDLWKRELHGQYVRTMVIAQRLLCHASRGQIQSVRFLSRMLRYIVEEVGNMYPAKGATSSDSSDPHYSPANAVRIMNDCILDCVEAATSMKDLLPTINDYPPLEPDSDPGDTGGFSETKEGILAI